MQSNVPTLSPEAADFAPGLLAIQESPPARLPRAMLYSVAALIGGLLLWARFGRLDIVANANGRLVPQTYVKIVQPADSGIVEEILVREGQRVAAGQVLLRMDPKDADADTKALRVQLALRSLELRRIDAELGGRRLLQDPTDPPDLFAQVAAQERADRVDYLDSLAQARDQLRRAQNDYVSGEAVLAKLEQTDPSLRSQAEAYADLGKRGYAPEVLVGDKERAYLENARDLQAQKATVTGLAAAEAQAAEQLGEVTAKYRSDLENQRVDAEGTYRKTESEWAKQQHKLALLELRAPVAGVVENLATHTVGTVVSAGTMLLSLVPDRVPLVAEVMIRNSDIGFAHEGQKVKVKLAAYPFEDFGMLTGKVVQIWPDAADASGGSSKEDTAAGQPGAQQQTASFKALVSLDSQALNAHGETLALTAGMEVVAQIYEGRQTVLDYLLSPIRRTLAESGHER
jgi:HlyD family secretion protein